MSKIQIYHGSPNIIQKPLFGYGKSWNDYGLGFYCTEQKELAKEWAVSDGSNGYSNKYTLDTKDLSILDLQNYTMLHWLAILVQHRQFQITTSIMKKGTDYLKEYFYLPAEDTAVHKSVASYVDKEFRQKATKDTCYIKQNGDFLPAYSSAK